MKNTIIYLFIALFAIITSCNTGDKQSESVKDPLVVEIPDSLPIEKKIAMLPDVEATSIIMDSTMFSAGFKLMITQPLDHNDLEKGSFQQKVYLSHADESLPMVMYLDGYSVKTNGYINELTDIIGSNYIHVEHRYFGESVPDSLQWEFLTIKQSAADHHKIVKLLKNIYKNKWISTGISKGGQTTMYHRRFYPEDVDVSVPYVAPLNLAMEDTRIYDFLDNVGTEECRNDIRQLQLFLFENYEEAFAMFEEKSKAFKYEFSIPMEQAFELSVLELEFAFWQWGTACGKIPAEDASLDKKINFMFFQDAPGFFTAKTMEDLFPFFYQAYAEMGMYGYRIDMFKNHLRFYKEDVCNLYTFIPEEYRVEFDSEAMKDINDWLKEHGNNFIYIYGEKDAWSSTAFEPSEKTNSISLIKEEGSHRTRISNLPAEQQKIIYDQLEEWLGIKVNRELI